MLIAAFRCCWHSVRVGLSAWACALLVSTAYAQAWPEVLDSSLAKAGIPRHAIAITVQDVSAPAPLLSHRGDVAMNPASVMKLVTSYAALDRLGPAYTWKTRLLTRADIRRQVLHGDLLVEGGGDPRLSQEKLWLLLRDLRAQGVQRIAGDVVTDRSLFHLPPYDPGAFDQRPLRPYNAPIDALTVDYNAVRLRLKPTTNGATAYLDPQPVGLSIENRIRRSPNGGCGDPTNVLSASKKEGSKEVVVVLDGALPAGCSEGFDWNLAPLPPERLFEGLFRTLWKELGGEIGGQFRNGSVPADARLLAENISPTLPEVLRDMNKWSNNVIARQMLATLGAQAEPGENSVAAGARTAQRSLANNGISTAGLNIENGAGLSRTERITASTLNQLLLSAWHSRTMPELLASLPVAGIDGTARKRLANSPAAGSAHVKTGTIDGVRSLAGYVLANNGHRYTVVLMINHPNASAAKEVQDALLEWVASL